MASRGNPGIVKTPATIIAASALACAAAGPCLGRGLDPGFTYKEVTADFHMPNAAEMDALRHQCARCSETVDLFLSKVLWAEALQQLDERTDMVRPVVVRIKFDDVYVPKIWEGADVRWNGTEAEVNVMISRLTGTTRASAVKLLAHELTHVYQMASSHALESTWLVEGMAEYGADGRYCPNGDYDIGPLTDHLQTDNGSAYWRGLLFFQFLEREFGLPTAKAFIAKTVMLGKSYQPAATEATKLDWSELASKELSWSREFVRSQCGSAPARVAPPAANTGPAKAAVTVAESPGEGAPVRRIEKAGSLEQACVTEISLFCAESENDRPKLLACLAQNPRGLMPSCRAAIKLTANGAP